MNRAWRVAAAAFCLILAACRPDQAGGLPEGAGYDFLVLSLSWSPSYCAAEGAAANRQQCGARRGHGFVVHGLWPQFESGWPEFCESEEPARVPEALVRDLLDIMPSAGLIGHQWRKHGSCSGLSQRDYFSLVMAAQARIAVPPPFEQTANPKWITPDEIESAFIETNVGLPSDGIAVTCRGEYLSEVRICLTKALKFRSCAEVNAHACRRRGVTVPPSH